MKYLFLILAILISCTTINAQVVNQTDIGVQSKTKFTKQGKPIGVYMHIEYDDTFAYIVFKTKQGGEFRLKAPNCEGIKWLDLAKVGTIGDELRIYSPDSTGYLSLFAKNSSINLIFSKDGESSTLTYNGLDGLSMESTSGQNGLLLTQEQAISMFAPLPNNIASNASFEQNISAGKQLYSLCVTPDVTTSIKVGTELYGDDLVTETEIIGGTSKCFFIGKMLSRDSDISVFVTRISGTGRVYYDFYNW